jgi:hypothetical protein
MSAIDVSVSSKRYLPRASSSGENLQRLASTAFFVRSWFNFRTLLDGDFSVRDSRAGARIRFAIAKTPIGLILEKGAQRAHGAALREPAQRYPESVTLSRIIFL